MSDKAAFKACYSDLKFIKGRKVAQVVLELAIEEAGAFVEAFGTPNPATETWVAIALLDLSHANEPDTGSRGIMNVGLEHHEADKPKRKFEELPIAQRAALLCKREAFWKFVECSSEEEAARTICVECSIISRSELSTNRNAAARFEAMETDFNSWLEGYGF